MLLYVDAHMSSLLPGTTWMQEMVTLILSRGDPTPSQTVPNWARAPWLEQYYCPQVLSAAQGPRILTTHLPYHALASALKASNTKVRPTNNTLEHCILHPRIL